MNTIIITLGVIPGSGFRQVTLPRNATLATLVDQERLQGRSLSLGNANGSQSIDQAAWGSTQLHNNDEVVAGQVVKGA